MRVRVRVSLTLTLTLTLALDLALLATELAVPDFFAVPVLLPRPAPPPPQSAASSPPLRATPSTAPRVLLLAPAWMLEPLRGALVTDLV